MKPKNYLVTLHMFGENKPRLEVEEKSLTAALKRSKLMLRNSAVLLGGVPCNICITPIW